MSNINAPRGFKPVRMKDGSDNIPMNAYTILDTYSTKIHTGAAVKQVAGGRVELAAAGDSICGVFGGVRYTSVEGESVWKKYWDTPTGATDIECLVYDDPNTIFEVQADGEVGAKIGNTGDLVAGTPDDKTGLSGQYFNAATATDGNKVFRIRGIVKRPDNVDGDYVKIEVETVAAKHQLV